MEITFIASDDYECPYCHNMLEDTEDDMRICNSEGCKGRKFKTFEVER